MINLHLSMGDWFVVGAYVALLLYLGFKGTRVSASSNDNYFVGGRLLSLPAFVAGLVSTWYGGILGVGEFSYLYGLANWVVFGAPYYVFALVFALFFAGKVRKSRLYSIPEKLAETYDVKTSLLGAVFVFFTSSPAPYLLMLAVLFQAVTGMELGVALAIASVLSIGYVVTGGFQSVVRTDLLQFIMMFGGFIVLVAFLVASHGAFPFLAENLPAQHLSATGGNSWQFIAVWFFIAMLTLVSPPFHQFALSAKNESTAKWGIVVSVLCWMVFDFLTTTAGLYARALLPNLENPVMAYPLLADAVLPDVAKGIFFVGMLGTVMSTVYGFGFVAAVTVGNDVFARFLPAKNSGSLRRYTQWGMIITLVVSILGILAFPSVIDLWYVIGTLFIPGLLLPLLTAYYPRLAINRHWTFAAMLAGFGMSSAAFLYGVMQGSLDAPNYVCGIEPMYPGLLGSIVVYCAGYVGNKRGVLSDKSTDSSQR